MFDSSENGLAQKQNGSNTFLCEYSFRSNIKFYCDKVVGA